VVPGYWVTSALFFSELSNVKLGPGGPDRMFHRIFQAAEMQKNFPPVPGLSEELTVYSRQFERGG
jgi:hypothetical protein